MSFPQHYENVTRHIVALCPAPDKFAHMTAGLFFWLAAAIILRKPLRSLLPLMVIVVLEIANEYVDYLAHDSWRWHDTIGDAAATWFWPFFLTLCLVTQPKLRA